MKQVAGGAVRLSGANLLFDVEIRRDSEQAAVRVIEAQGWDRQQGLGQRLFLQHSELRVE